MHVTSVYINLSLISSSRETNHRGFILVDIYYPRPDEQPACGAGSEGRGDWGEWLSQIFTPAYHFLPGGEEVAITISLAANQ